MAKIDKSQFTKEEWKIIREQRRQEKINLKLSSMPTDSFNILCLKHGSKYPSEYVNRLYNMCKRHCTLDFTFACLTDNPEGIHKDIVCLDLPSNLAGWWCKPYMFSADIPLEGTILYMDLDVVIANNIDKLFTYSPDDWCTVRDFTRVMRPKWEKYNSSVVRFKKGQLDRVWRKYNQNPRMWQKRFFGDQDYLWDADKSAVLFPDAWIRSWKWEIRKTKNFEPGGVKGKRILANIEHVEPPMDCCITVFHGDPNPEHCKDPWVLENWK